MWNKNGVQSIYRYDTWKKKQINGRNGKYRRRTFELSHTTFTIFFFYSTIHRLFVYRSLNMIFSSVAKGKFKSTIKIDTNFT